MDILPNGSFALSGFSLIATLSKGYAILCHLGSLHIETVVL